MIRFLLAACAALLLCGTAEACKGGSGASAWRASVAVGLRPRQVVPVTTTTVVVPAPPQVLAPVTPPAASMACRCKCGCGETGVCTCGTDAGAKKTAAPKATSSVVQATNSLPAGWHTHQCRFCGTTFSHGSESHGNHAAHRCPNCHRVEFGNFVAPARSVPTTTNVVRMPAAMPQTFQQIFGSGSGGCPGGRCPNR